MNILELVDGLQCGDDKFAYGCLKELEKMSSETNDVYNFMDKFIEMFSDSNSYVRTRGLRLFAVNSKWDTEGKTEAVLDAYFEHITDEKPTVARQCIQYLKFISNAKPELNQQIDKSRNNADFSKYRDNMSPLLCKDREQILNKIR